MLLDWPCAEGGPVVRGRLSVRPCAEFMRALTLLALSSSSVQGQAVSSDGFAREQ